LEQPNKRAVTKRAKTTDKELVSGPLRHELKSAFSMFFFNIFSSFIFIATERPKNKESA